MNIDWSKAPEDATHFNRSGLFFKFDENLNARFYDGFWWRANGLKLGDYDTMGELIERPKKQEAWYGDGLPPVGTVCDMHIDDFGWITGTVVVHIDLDEPTAVAHNGKEVFHGNASAFRPIKTDEQLEEEEKKKVIDDMQRIYEE